MKKTRVALPILGIIFVFLAGLSVAMAQASGTMVFLPLICQNTSGDTAAATATASAATAYSQNGGTVTQSNQNYAASNADQSAVYVTNGGKFTLSNSTITKTGNTSSNDNSSFYGLNAAVLAEDGSTITLSDSAINSTGSGANGAFSTGSGSTVALSNVTIQAVGGGAHGVMATQGGVMTLTNVNITTTGANSAPIATDRGGGTITVTGGNSVASGQDSPCLYSTGSLKITDASCSASGSESVVIEGANAIVATNTSLTSSKESKWGVLIYQSMSGDAEGKQGAFTMTGGTLANTAVSGPLFHVTNTTAIITLNGVTVTATSGTLLNAGADRWGTSGSNGGTVVLSANGQSLRGSVVIDAISSFTASIKSSSSLTGAIDAANTASAAYLTLDSSSQWNVTADSYLTCLTDTDGISGTAVSNIAGNGHTVYYNASACSALSSQTYTLSGGGFLKPGD